MASQFFAVVVFFFSVGSVVMTTLVSMSALFFSSSSITSKNEGFAVSAFDGRGRYSLHPHRSQAIKYCTFSSKMSPGIICPRGRALMLMSSESEDDSTNRRIFLRTAATASTAAVASGIFCDAAVAMSTPTQQLRWLPDPINPRRNGLPLTTPESVYPLKFVTYLSRFLLNFDRSCRRWWFASAGKIDKELGAEAVALERERQFGAFAASVEVGLRDYLDREGPNRLLQNLLTKYGSEGYIAVDYGSRSARESMEARRQIALLFGLMEASDMQPVEALTGLLAVIENATIVEVDVEDGGSGYAPGYGSPRVYFPPPEAGAGNIVVGGKQGKEQTPVGVVGEKFRMASGTAIMRPSGAILRIDLINHGSGYTKAPLVTVSPPKNIDGYVNSRSAQATATLFTRGANKGKIMRIDLIDGGMGYVEDEKIEVKVELPEGRVFDERGTQAVAKAIMELKVGSIEITDGGSGYAAERPLLLGVDPPPITARVNLNDKLVFLTNREIAERAANKNDSGQCVGRGCYDRNVIAYAYAGSNRTSYAAARNEQDSTWLERMEAAVEGKDYIGETAKFRAYAVNVGDKKNVRGMGATSDGGPTAGSVIELPFWTGESSASSRLLALLPSGVGLVFDRKVKRYILMNGDNSSSLRQVTPSSTNILQPIEFYFGPRGRNPIERQKKLDLSTTLRISASGAICASVVHTALTPIDVVKTKMQTNPAEYPDPVRSLKKLVDEEGIRSFFNGWQPTFLGFFVWGGFAYISTEYFRRLIIDFVGVGATTLEVPIILAAAATSAFFGSFLIAPFETVRIRTVAEPKFGSNIFTVSGRILMVICVVEMPLFMFLRSLLTLFSIFEQEEGVGAFFDSVPVFLLKEIPFACAKFAVFDITTEQLYDAFPAAREDLQLSLLITLAAGTFGGIIAAIVSNPADCTISELKKSATDISPTDAANLIIERGGLLALFKGLTLRMAFYSLMVGGQFLLYDTIRFALGVGSDDLKLYLDVLGSALSAKTAGSL